MRFIVLLLSLSLSLTLSACHNDSAQFTDSNGQPVNLKLHPHRWLVINYWASWCSHCRDEIAEFNVFYQSHHQQALVYGVNYDHLPLDQLKSTAKRMGIDYPLLVFDPAKTLDLGPIESLPVTFIYDPSGALHTVLHGAQTAQSLELALD